MWTTSNVYPEIDEWTDDRLVSTYRRLSRDFRRHGYDDETVARMFTVEKRMRQRGLDPQIHASEVEREVRQERIEASPPVQ